MEEQAWGAAITRARERDWALVVSPVIAPVG